LRSPLHRCLHAVACLLACALLASCSDSATDSSNNGPADDGGWQGEASAQSSPFRLQVSTGDTVLWRQAGPIRLALADGGDTELTDLLAQASSGNVTTYTVATDTGGTASVRLTATGGAFKIALDTAGVTAVDVPVALTPGERIYGLTERLVDSTSVEVPGRFVPPVEEFNPDTDASLDRRGEVVEMFVRPTMSLYAPFYHSSRGYGLWVEGTFPGVFDIGAREPGELSIHMETAADRGLVFNILLGPEHARILRRYHEQAGFPIRVPDWAFLHWRWRDELTSGASAVLDGVPVNADIAEDVLMYERFGIPPGVYLFDRPYLVGGDDPASQGFHRFTWDETRLPNIGSTLESLRARGYRLAVWSAAWARDNGPDSHGAEAAARGYLAPGSERVIDLTNPDAAAWWRDKLATFAADWDISAIKLDRGEEFIPSADTDIYFDGRSGREVHNAFPVLQAQVHHDAMQSVRGDDFLVLSRAGYSGSQRWAANWGGDDRGSEAGLRSAIVRMQRAGFIGFPTWGSDTGGYYAFRDREVFARWLQFSALTPIMEIGGIGSRSPWAMPGEPYFDTELIDIYTRYVRLHHDLLAYTARQADLAAATGMPIARAMVFDFPEDPRFADCWEQYMYGPDLLVAPVWRSGAREQRVLIPEGVWSLFWDRSRSWTGPTEITLAAPLDVLPLFIRDGATVLE